MQSFALFLFFISFVKTMLKILSVENYAITKWVMMVYQVIMNEVCLMHILAFKCANEQYIEYRIKNIEVLFSW